MIEQIGDIFSQPDADAICFTSNGIVKSNGELTMGAGIAKAFRDKFPTLAKLAGTHVNRAGNHAHRLIAWPREINRVVDRHIDIVSFPTKNHWRDQSDIKLIERSAHELIRLANIWKWKKCYITRMGCGLGGLSWETQVKPVVAPILDDRFIILTPK